MRRNCIALLFVLTIALAAVPLYGKTYAAVLQFDPKASEAAVGETFDVNVNIDARSDQIAGTDVYITYDPTLVEPQAVSQGTYFPLVTNNITSGKIVIQGVVENGSQYQSGPGTVATITFKALKKGTGTLKFDCDLAQTQTSKIVKNDINATNVIECSALTTNVVTVSALAGGANDGSGNDSSTVTELPQSGVYDSVVKLSVPGIALLALGLLLRVFLKV